MLAGAGGQHGWRNRTLGMNLSIGEREFVQIGQMRKFEPDHIVNLADEQGYVCKASYFDEEMPFVLCLFRFGD